MWELDIEHMTISRRAALTRLVRALGTAAAVPALAALFPWSQRLGAETESEHEGPFITHGPIVGGATAGGVPVWVRSSQPARFQIQAREPHERWPGVESTSTGLHELNDFAGVIPVAGLNTATTYEYRVLLDGKPRGSPWQFRTLPAQGQPAAFRLAIGGDLLADMMPFTILDQILEQRPDLLILLGDLVYSDHPRAIPPTVEAYRTKYRTNWADPSFRRLTSTVPTFMMWDDHEIVNDYDGRDEARYPAARSALETYVTPVNPAPVRPSYLYYTFRVGDVDFFVLDTRSHRGPNGLADGPGKSMLGSVQMRDLLSWLIESRAPFKVIMSSVPMHDLGPARVDAWSAFARERNHLLDVIEANSIRGVVVLSGDQHWSSLVHHDRGNIWEFNATPLAQFVQRAPAGSPSELALAYDGSTAFGLVDIDTRAADPSITFSIVDNAGVVRGQRRLTLSDF